MRAARPTSSPWRWLAWLACLGFGVAHAEVFRDVRYQDTLPVPAERQSVDVFVPARPGPHAVVLYLGDSGDKARAALAPQGFVSRDQVLMVAGFRDEAAGKADVAAALAWALRQSAVYGGDPKRVFVWARGGGAQQLLALARDARALREAGLADVAPRGLVLIDAPATGDEAALDAPRLHLVAQLDDQTMRATTTGAEHLRARGIDVQVVPVARRALLGAAGDDIGASGFAWMEAHQIDRLQRAENLRVSVYPLDTREPPPRFTRSASAERAVFAATTVPARVFRLCDGDTSWQLDRAFTSWQALLDLRNTESAPNVGDGVLLALGREGERARLRARFDDTWTAVRLPETARADDDTRLLVARARAGRDAAVIIAFDREVYALTRAQQRWRASARPALPGRITGLAFWQGKLHATVATGAGEPGGVFQLDGETSWRRVNTPASLGANGMLEGLWTVPAPDDNARETLMSLDGDRVLRFDPGQPGPARVELEAGVTFRNLWRGLGGGGSRLRARDVLRFAQPESGAPLWLLPVELRHPDTARANAWYLVRRADARYAYGSVDVDQRSGASLPQVSPFIMDAGQALLFFGADGALLQARFHRAAPRVGVWGLPGESRRGLLLARAGDSGFAYWFDVDAEGAPRWSLAVGQLGANGFDPDLHGLATYRRAAGEGGKPRRDEAAQRPMQLHFGREADECAADPSPAQAHAALTLGEGEDIHHLCLRPLSPETSPSVAHAAGLWYGGALDGGWSLAIAPDGGNGRARVLLFFFDAAGEPRWVEGRGELINGRGGMALTWPPSCDGCPARAAGGVQIRVDGQCDEIDAHVEISVYDRQGRALLDRPDARMERAAGGACY